MEWLWNELNMNRQWIYSVHVVQEIWRGDLYCPKEEKSGLWGQKKALRERDRKCHREKGTGSSVFLLKVDWIHELEDISFTWKDINIYLVCEFPTPWPNSDNVIIFLKKKSEMVCWNLRTEKFIPIPFCSTSLSLPSSPPRNGEKGAATASHIFPNHGSSWSQEIMRNRDIGGSCRLNSYVVLLTGIISSSRNWLTFLPLKMNTCSYPKRVATSEWAKSLSLASGLGRTSVAHNSTCWASANPSWVWMGSIYKFHFSSYAHGTDVQEKSQGLTAHLTLCEILTNFEHLFLVSYATNAKHTFSETFVYFSKSLNALCLSSWRMAIADIYWGIAKYLKIPLPAFYACQLF